MSASFYKCCNCNCIHFNLEGEEECWSCGSTEHQTDLEGHFISLDMSIIEDIIILNWINENREDELLITSVDTEFGLVMVEGCPFTISHEYIDSIHG